MELPGRWEVFEQARQAGRRIVAALPIHYPRALLRAYGFHPMEVWGPPNVSPARDDSHFQAYTCPIVQHATYFLTEGAGAQVDCILIPHTCDAMQGMASVFQCFIEGGPPVLTVHHPRGRRECDEEFLEAELRRLADELGRIAGTTPSEAELREAVRAEAEADRVFAELWGDRAHMDLSDREFYSALRTREYLPAETFVEYAAGLPRRAETSDGVGLMVSGIVPEPMSLFDYLNDRGATVVTDDLACCGRRVYDTPENGDPFRTMAKQLMSMPPDPTIGVGIPERNAFVLQRVREAGAKGVLIYDVKFCEPELFYIPLLQKACKEAGIPVLHVEVELGDTIPGQVLNRIDAFLEVLQ